MVGRPSRSRSLNRFHNLMISRSFTMSMGFTQVRTQCERKENKSQAATNRCSVGRTPPAVTLHGPASVAMATPSSRLIDDLEMVADAEIGRLHPQPTISQARGQLTDSAGCGTCYRAGSPGARSNGGCGLANPIVPGSVSTLASRVSTALSVRNMATMIAIVAARATDATAVRWRWFSINKPLLRKKITFVGWEGSRRGS